MKSPAAEPIRVGVDTGGTFTDFVALVDGRLATAKVLSTPDDPARAILEGLDRLGIDPDRADLVHGTTVGTNAVLEDRGAAAAFVTCTGFADLLTLGRQNRDSLYALEQPPVEPPVPAERCFEVAARTAADGRNLARPSERELAELAQAVEASGAEAVAVCLLFSWLEPDLEQRIADALPAHIPVSCSHRVLPEIREYERGIATWLNASIGPRLAGYLGRLAEALHGGRLAVMQSSGLTISADQAAERAVHLLLSGPAGGLAAAAHIGRQLDEARLLTFDMGGTSTDVALLEGRPRLTAEGRIGRYPVAVPMVDMHTIGAGGGSVARVDAGGLIQVGPRSAGADPGPACYGRGGTEPTVTDANLLLGRIPAGVRLGGRHALDHAAARAALQRLADDADLDIDRAAAGVIRIANEHMSRALRVMSAERGLDPKRCRLACFGGAGGLHVCELAESLGMRRAVVPARSGVLSALGMLVAEPGRQFTATVLTEADGLDAARVDAAFGPLEDRAREELVAEGTAADRIDFRRRAGCRYTGQSASLELDIDPPEALIERFHQAHEAAFGHRLDLPVEWVTARLDARGPARLDRVPPPDEPVDVPDGAEGVSLFARNDVPESGVRGPAIVLDADATTWVAEGWTARRAADGHLLLDRAD